MELHTNTLAAQDRVEDNPDPWTLIDSVIGLRSSDAQFWWERTGRMLARLLEGAKYTTEEQFNELFVFALLIAPELGPAPDENGNLPRWQSSNTPDSTPTDFSWEWRPGNKGTVRYTFEPIGPHAGTPSDPLNQYAANLWLAKLQKHNLVPGLDLEWYDHFTRHILPGTNTEGTRTVTGQIKGIAPVAGCYLARDLEPTGPVVKAYLYPGLKSHELGISSLDLAERAIRSLPDHQLASLDFEPLFEYLHEGVAKYSFLIELIGVDCVDPKAARIKFYVRAPHTSIAYLMDALTLGGRRPHDGSDDALQDLKALWTTFLGDAPDVLPASTPVRSQPGFYYTISAGKPVSPKVYFSPEHWCKNEFHFLSRLRGYFSSRRSDQMMDNYEQAMRTIYGTEILDKRCGSHYYIGCALHKGQLRIVTYLNPQTITIEREAIRNGVNSK